MKLKTSFSKFTTFRKDITRFAPLWIIYFVGGLLVMLTVFARDSAYNSAHGLAAMMIAMGPINFVYASMAANLLFGDLFNSRMCNAIHAAPLRREHLYVSHVGAGFCFSLVPHAVAILVMMFYLQQYWLAGLYWLAANAVEYLFFFGVAVFSCMCTGSRFAMVVVDGIINFVSILALWFCDTVYLPLLYGVVLREEGFINFCPVVKLTTYSINRIIPVYDLSELASFRFSQNTVESWQYLGILGVLGVVALAAAFVLYRRRHLECAGDFLAFKPTEPIFLTVYTLCVGASFAVVGHVFGSYEVYLVIGLIIGFFTGTMLIKRTVKVFQKKTILGAVLFAVLGLASLVVVFLDPLGITTWVPKDTEVSSVTVYYRGIELNWNGDPEALQEFRQIHREAIAQKNAEDAWNDLRIIYQLKNGQTVQRRYSVNSELMMPYRDLLSSVEAVFKGHSESYIRQATSRITLYSPEGTYMIKGADVDALLDAIIKDCREGTIIQEYMFHEGYTEKISLELWEDRQDSEHYERYLCGVRVFDDSRNTMAWINEYIQKQAPVEDEVKWG